MLHLVYIEFFSDGPFGEEAATAYAELAADIAAQDGLLWKVWTEDPAASTAGGVYLFTDEDSANAYVDKHTRRLGSFGISDAKIRTFSVNESLSRTTRATLTQN
jgi:Putative mono-oxygenase ydhR